jgi:hypothetical protein
MTAVVSVTSRGFDIPKRPFPGKSLGYLVELVSGYGSRPYFLRSAVDLTSTASGKIMVIMK